MKLKSIAIYKPQETVVYEVGKKILFNGEISDIAVISISVSFFNTVRIETSDGNIYVFRGIPISYQQ